MLKFMQALFASKEFHLADMEIKVMPQYKSMAFLGLAELLHYGPFKEGEKRFEGGESRQIRERLQKMIDETEPGLLLEIKIRPTLKRNRETNYEFSITQNFPGTQEKRKEVELMREAGLLLEHSFPINPERSFKHYEIPFKKKF
ncbi:Uncharacterised protein [Candidatus Gugararchaeum adminiculabundum]|nr:Uncharacterised protein [Candidatus Gugararchaeum adminiculabundum]